MSARVFCAFYLSPNFYVSFLFSSLLLGWLSLLSHSTFFFSVPLWKLYHLFLILLVVNLVIIACIFYLPKSKAINTLNNTFPISAPSYASCFVYFKSIYFFSFKNPTRYCFFYSSIESMLVSICLYIYHFLSS